MPGSGKCINCKFKDTYSGPFYSYKYCKPKDLCLEDAWQHYNAYCQESWKDGYNLDIEKDCRSTVAPDWCQSFESDPKQSGVNTTGTKTLRQNEWCTISIDARKFPARIILDPDMTQKNLGIIYSGYNRGDWITVD